MNHLNTSPVNHALLLSLLASACAAPQGSMAARMEASAVASAAEAKPGAAGLGDPLFPEAGNGGYDVQSYELVIALEKTDGPIDASTTIRAKSTQALSTFDLDLHALDVRSIEVDGAAAKFTREGDELIVTPPKSIQNGAEFTTLVRYGGVPEGVLDPAFPIPLKLGWMAKNGEVYVVSEPTGAKSFFPCNDHPRDKALYTIRVTVPKPLEVVANGKLAETIDGGEKRTFVYKPRDPISTYLVTIAIAAFETSDLTGPNGLPIRNYFSPQTKAGARKSFERTDAIIEFLGRTFGEYPFEVCGNILSSIELPGALETQTLPTYGAHAGSEDVICHELAHQWFGDSVSVENWQDIWLNEGFAEYASWMYSEATNGKDAEERKVKFEKLLRSNYGSIRAMSSRPPREGQDPAKKAIPEPPPGNPSVKSLFGSNVYIRGALALHALRTEVGDEAFLKLMRGWAAGRKNGNASVADFANHVEKNTSKAARAVLEHWINDAEMPHVAAWDEALAKDKAERDAKKKAREDKRKKDEGGEKKDG
jgi:aminopeptidase N